MVSVQVGLSEASVLFKYPGDLKNITKKVNKARKFAKIKQLPAIVKPSVVNLINKKNKLIIMVAISQLLIIRDSVRSLLKLLLRLQHLPKRF